MSSVLTEALAEKAFSAIGIAEAEAGDEDGYYDDLRAALYSLYPSIKARHEAKAAEDKALQEKHTQLRKDITEECLRTLNRRKKLLPQVMAFHRDNYASIHQHSSDAICLSADLWRYASPKVMERLASEVRGALDPSNRGFYLSKPNSEIWHALSDILSADYFDKRSVK